MYTLEQLQQKTFKELKEIGWELNALPAGDRRCRQNWIEAIAGVQPPLLQPQEASPSVEPAAEAIEQAAKNSPGVDRPVENFTEGDRPPNRGDSGRDRLENETKMSQSAIAPAAENPPGVDIDLIEEQLNEPLAESSPLALDCPFCGAQHGLFATKDRLDRSVICCLHCSYSRPKRYPGAIKSLAQEQAAKNSPGVSRKTSTAHELLELFKSSAHIIPDSPAETEAVIESAIGQTEVGQNPAPTGCTLSAEFLARYSPPQSEIICFQADTDGQLSLLDFQVESFDEPPDPDDFEFLDAFREAMARWDAENPESPTVSMDSMREWAPCPGDWYEPAAEILPLEAPSMEVMELSPAIETTETSSTCNFSIPTFDAWCDRQNNTDDEPPDTGIFARRPLPKPPSFPPVSVAAGDRSSSIKKFARCAALVSGRAPPGGDAA